MNWSRAIVVALVMGALSAWFGYDRGYDAGVLRTQAAHDKAQAVSLNAKLEQVSKEIVASTAASRELRLAVASIETSSTKSTKELKNALTKNGGQRVLCHFDDDSMRILATAADYADLLASRGIRGAMPAGDPPDR